MNRVELSDVRAGYAAAGNDVLNGVSLTLEPGQLCAVLGANGSGKSTLLRVIAGLLPARGRMTIGTQPIDGSAPTERARRIAFVPQQHETSHGFTVQEVVMMGRAPHQGALMRATRQDEAIVTEVLASCNLDQLASRQLHALSGGEQQRVHIARALAQRAGVLLLDEATAHLDVRHALALQRLVRREVSDRKLACLAVMHDLAAAARHADRVLLLRHGEVLAFGSVPDVMTSELLGETFGTAITTGTAPVTDATGAELSYFVAH